LSSPWAPSFPIKDLTDSADVRAVVEAVVRLAHALGLRVVAEGVETDSQRDMLLGFGCEELQGYLFARPMPAQQLASQVRERAHASHPDAALQV
jgi:EAL domain-containing protein (putative c-di-GMP-specific phosphodiesterase class I)